MCAINDDKNSQISESEPIARRTFLRYLAGGAAALIGIVAGAPIIGYVTAPLRRSGPKGEWVELGALDGFSGREPTQVQFTVVRKDGWVEAHEAKACWVVPDQESTVIVLNGKCTHLGCAYRWVEDGEGGGMFHCPCHDGDFDREGNVVSGPPPRALDRLETKIENGVLSAFYQDFRLGVAQKTTL